MQLEYTSNPVPLRMHLDSFEHAQTFRLVTGMCPNIRNAHRIQLERLECTSIVNECRRNFHSDGIPAHSDTRVTRV